MQRDGAPLHEHDAAAPANAPPTPEPPQRRIDSTSLLGTAQEVEINHVGQIYRLRRTSLGKLILTK